MDEKNLLESVKKAIKEELNVFKQGMVTKDNLKPFATKENLRALKVKLVTKEDSRHLQQKKI